WVLHRLFWPFYRSKIHGRASTDFSHGSGLLRQGFSNLLILVKYTTPLFLAAGPKNSHINKYMARHFFAWANGIAPGILPTGRWHPYLLRSLLCFYIALELFMIDDL